MINGLRKYREPFFYANYTTKIQKCKGEKIMSKQKLSRSINMGFRVTEKEQEMIYNRMKQAKINTLREYLLKMAVDGRVVEINPTGISECSRLLRNISNNINQIAKRANETGNVYPAHIEEIIAQQDEIWMQQEKIIRSLAKLVKEM